MAEGLNKVQLIGNLGRDPETRYTQSGVAVCNLSVATTERRKARNSQEYEEHTEWHRVVVWNKLAETCDRYLSKGRTVYIEGQLQTRKWQDRDGNDKYTTEINARRVLFLGGGSGGDGGGGGGQRVDRGSGYDQGPPPDQGGDDEIPF